MVYCWKWNGVENEVRFKNEEQIIQDDYRIEFISEHLKKDASDWGRTSAPSLSYTILNLIYNICM